MATSSQLRALVVVVVLLLLAAPAAAQSRATRYVRAEAGLNSETADDFSGQSAGGGFAFGVAFADRWTTEVAFWLPGYIRPGAPEYGKRHRDIQINAAVIRSFGTGRIRPFGLFGFTGGYTEDAFTNCIALRPRSPSGELVTAVVDCRDPDVTSREEDSFGGFLLLFLAGLGADIPVTQRVSIVPQVRFDAGVGTVIVRPMLGVKFAF